MSSPKCFETPASPRPRLSRQERFCQLLDVSWCLIREEGTDALTLGRLAEKAGVTKPVVYGHFGTRNGLLVALYKDYDEGQTAMMDAALVASQPTLAERAEVIASSYVACVLRQGREMPGVLAALTGSPELEKVKREYLVAFIEKCRSALAPFTGADGISPAAFWAMLGAADALSHAAAKGEITAEQAQDELLVVILAMVERSHSSNRKDVHPSAEGIQIADHFATPPQNPAPAATNRHAQIPRHRLRPGPRRPRRH